MKLRRFYWSLTITLIAVCIYQLSFTYVAVNIENKSSKEAEIKVKELQKKAKQTGDSALLPNGVFVHFNSPEGYDIAKASFINEILKNKAKEEVFLGTEFAAVKRRALAFGLDLVGGMSVTMEVSVPDLIKSNVSNQRNIEFIKAFDQANNRFSQERGEFLTLFVQEYKNVSTGKPLNKLFAGSKFKGQSDTEIISYFEEVIDNSIDRVETILEKRINQFGVAQPNIQKDAKNNRIYIELPGVQDEATVSEKLKSTANLEFYAIYAKPDLGKQFEEADRVSRLKEKSIAELETEDTLNLDKTKGTDKGLFDYLKIENMGGPIGYVSQKDKYFAETLLKRNDVSRSFSTDLKLMWSAKPEKIGDTGKEGFFLYAVEVPKEREAEVSGKDVGKASQGYDAQTGKITVDLEMTDEGARNWSKMTKKNIGKPVAISMDNVVYSAPVVNEELSKNSQISGNFSFEEAKDLSGLLNGGSLPVPCIIVEKTKVGPTIGEENTKSGLISFGVALLVVFAYMYFYYGKAGLVADIALFFNMVFIFGALASFSAVLTLAGIAGIVLTIGMAVDANVLIFERVREELANGKDQEAAIETGFSKALSSIIDSNVTTLLTAIVLKIFGTGPIESFATTLIIGIFSSVFSAIIISRLIFEWMMKRKQGISFSSQLTKNAFKNINVNFIDKRKYAYVVSSILVLGSVILIFTKGLNQSVEFSGGRTVPVTFEKSASQHIESIKTNLAKTMPGASIEVKTKESGNVVDVTTNYLLADSESETKVNKALEEGLALSKAEVGKATVNYENDRFVSSNVAGQIKSSAVLSMSIALALIFLYIFIRFGTWQYSFSAIVALFHDVIIVVGIFSLFNGIFPFNMDLDQALIAAFLTVVGYSINDTVVVFDRIRENLSWKKDADFKVELNDALNSTLSRTINTSFTTVLVLIIIFLFGGTAIKGFIFALLVGIAVGTYSSLMIATPLLIDLTKKIIVKK